MDKPWVNAGEVTFAEASKLEPYSDLELEDVRCWDFEWTQIL
jgi:hypothetical protein